MRVFGNIVCIVMIIACLVGAGLLRDRAVVHRENITSTSAIGTAVRDPQIILLTHLLGGFKGLVIDAIWLRAGKLQEEGKYWELYQLYDWMGKLEPHLGIIWEFNAQNMSYNITAEIDDSAARWRWIAKSLYYLRFKGLKYNPRSGRIMKQIAFTFHHKIGRPMDLHHIYYKHRMAIIMNGIFGDREMQDMKGVMEAPETLAELLKDPDVAYALRDFDLDPEREPIALLDDGQGIYWIPKRVRHALFKNRTPHQQYGEFLASPKGRTARKVVNFVVAKAMHKRLKMEDLTILATIEEDYGKFDWRLPDPHALYWATLAVTMDTDLKKQLNLDRFVMFALNQTIKRGHISHITEPAGSGAFLTASDFTKIIPLDDLYEVLIKKYMGKSKYSHEGRSVRNSHESFLRDTARNLYFSGFTNDARYYYKKRKERYNKPPEDQSMEDYYFVEMKQYIEKEGAREGVDAVVSSMIRQAIIAYHNNDSETAKKFELLSKRAWHAYRMYDIEAGELRHEDDKKMPFWRDLYREEVRMIVSGKRPEISRSLVQIIRKNLDIAPGDENSFMPPATGMTKPIPPSSLDK